MSNLALVVDNTAKFCIKCSIVKNLEEFSRDRNRADGLQVHCKACNKIEAAEFKKLHPEKVAISAAKAFRKYYPKNKDKYTERHLKYRYGMTLAQKQAMFDKQEGLCAVCSIAFKDLSAARVDHNHTTKKVRELLCHNCNVSIGLLKENKQRIENIRLYLAKHDGNFANVSKFSAYLKEREGVDVIETAVGYATYLVSGEECLIKDIYVLPDHRQRRAASAIADRITAIAKEKGCKYLTGTVCPSANGSTTSMKVLIGYGMRLHSSTSNLIIFIKDIA